MKLYISVYIVELDDVAAVFPGDLAMGKGAWSTDFELPASQTIMSALRITDPTSVAGEMLPMSAIVQIGTAVYPCTLQVQRVERAKVQASLVVSLFPTSFERRVCDLAAEHGDIFYNWGRVATVQAPLELAAYDDGINFGNSEFFGQLPSNTISNILRQLQAYTGVGYRGLSIADMATRCTPTAVRLSPHVKSCRYVGVRQGLSVVGDASAYLLPNGLYTIGTMRYDVVNAFDALNIDWQSDVSLASFTIYINNQTYTQAVSGTAGSFSIAPATAVAAGGVVSITATAAGGASIGRIEWSVEAVSSTQATAGIEYDPTLKGLLINNINWANFTSNPMFKIGWYGSINQSVTTFLCDLAAILGYSLNYDATAGEVVFSRQQNIKSLQNYERTAVESGDSLAQRNYLKYSNESVLLSEINDTMLDEEKDIFEVQASRPGSSIVSIGGVDYVIAKSVQYQSSTLFLQGTSYFFSQRHLGTGILQPLTERTAELLPSVERVIVATFLTSSDVIDYVFFYASGHVWRSLEKTVGGDGITEIKALLIN